MRNASRLLRSVCVLCVATLFACDDPTSVNDQLGVTLSVERATITSGRAANVTVVVRNRGPRTLDVAPAEAYACLPPYVVYDMNDVSITLPGRICSLADYALHSLAPGDSLVIHDQWAGDKSNGTVNGSMAVAPGQYRVRARVTGELEILMSAPTTVSVVHAMDNP